MVIEKYFGIIKPLENHTTHKHARKINNPIKRSFQGNLRIGFNNLWKHIHLEILFLDYIMKVALIMLKA